MRTWLWLGANDGTVVCVEVGNNLFFNIQADGSFYLDEWEPTAGEMWVLA